MVEKRRDNKKRVLRDGEYQRPDGRYEYKYTDLAGQRHSVYSWRLVETDKLPEGRRPCKALRTMEKDISKDRDDGIDSSTAKKMTLNSMWDGFFESKQHIKQSTLVQYERAYRLNVSNSIGDIPISAIRYSTIKKLYADMLDSGVTLGYVKVVQNVLGQMFNMAVKDNIIRTNPTTGVTADLRRESHNGRKIVAGKRHALTKEQQTVLMSYIARKPRYERKLNLITFLLGTGCRAGEAGGLTWGDCDFDKNTIEIKRTMSYVKYTDEESWRLHITSTKTKSGTRAIPMLPEVRAALLDELEYQSIRGKTEGEVDGVSGFVWQTRNRTPISGGDIDYALKSIVKSYNKDELKISAQENREPILLPNISPHILRHTFCARLCENEQDLKIIQEIMGHSSIVITMDVYNEVTSEQKQASFESLAGKIVCNNF